MRLVSIDQGTTSTRSLLLESGKPPRIVHAVSHMVRYPHPGWVEHDPLELLANIRACLAAAGPATAIGLANQGESCLAWDSVTGEPLSPVIVWQDNRHAALVDGLRAQGVDALTMARASLPLDTYFSAGKFSWMLQNLPAVARALGAGRLRLGTTDAYFLQCLTGRCATDVSTASRTSLMNLRTAQWDEDLCAAFGVPLACLPPIQPSCGDFGDIAGSPLTASLVDQQAALFGHGCHAPGLAKFTFGTGAFALAQTGQEIVGAADSGLLPTVAWQLAGQPIQYAVDGGVFSAGAAVDWARELGLFQSVDELNRFDAPPAIERGLAFVPALTGLACPHWDREAGALWIGMRPQTGRRDLLQALLEGVALRAAEVIDSMAGLIAISGTLSLDGGLCNSPYFCQFLCDALQRPVRVPAFRELTALGAAQLAALGAGHEVPADGFEYALYTPGRPPEVATAWRDRFAQAVRYSGGWWAQ